MLQLRPMVLNSIDLACCDKIGKMRPMRLRLVRLGQRV